MAELTEKIKDYMSTTNVNHPVLLDMLIDHAGQNFLVPVRQTFMAITDRFAGFQAQWF